MIRVGIDIGSTTVKVVVLDEQDQMLYHSYERHFARVREKTVEQLRAAEQFLQGRGTETALWHSHAGDPSGGSRRVRGLL